MIRARFGRRARRFGARLFVPLVALLLVNAIAPLRLARAQQQPQSPERLPQRQANYAWDHATLRASFSYRDLVDPDLANKLSSGLPTTFAMRAYFFREGESEPVALAVRSCRVVYDLWDEVYRIRVFEQRRPERDTAVINVDGVMRLCAEARDLPVADRAQLRAGAPHFLAVIVDVNPVSEEMLEQMKRWVSRPTGSTNIGPSDALFGSFVGLFVRQIGNADKTLRFRTQAMAP
jgi:hypothetical protein